MVLAAARDHGLDLGKSWMVGDKCSDIEAGRISNMLTAQVYNSALCMPGPHIKAARLDEAADAILNWR